MAPSERDDVVGRVWSREIPGFDGMVIDRQEAVAGDPERFLVQPLRLGELARWLTRGQFEPR